MAFGAAPPTTSAKPTCSWATWAAWRASHGPRADKFGEAELTLFQPIKSDARQPRAHGGSHLEAPRGTPRRHRDQPSRMLSRRSLASPAKAPQAAATAAQVVWVEDKFDGVRTQLALPGGGRRHAAGWKSIRAICGASRASSRRSPRWPPAACADDGHLRRRDRRLRERQAALVLRPAKTPGPPCAGLCS